MRQSVVGNVEALQLDMRTGHGRHACKLIVVNVEVLQPCEALNRRQNRQAVKGEVQTAKVDEGIDVGNLNKLV